MTIQVYDPRFKKWYRFNKMVYALASLTAINRCISGTPLEGKADLRVK